uniref:non-specific serine/threonine protein kinase n=1 Tax=Chromera velia CCMP2878 TaxID=1169474 RepID=A0A0G4GNH3_9ALVE|eukprot:Cvel_22688.t1-p1 / transcript=Cvel_22688.t1 / gene=Cvel_22688 / organism=Chromera_velia_CCMP2878 / gene_product=Probable serine/threonine-protein kinase nek2, putative / transcript_product=Probable serine/threonine-protein kinase nek2, putative / location=Cvel_scaffold2258:15326-26402(-) / protein_length=887 / sequence_SO=supercontig / SO=protein_coding / is_pseudo=false
MSLADFQEVSHLGEGAYSSVYKVIRKSDGKDYALKKVKLPNLSDKEKQNALNEVRLLASVNIVTEYADGGDLYQKIVEHQKSRTYFKESDIWRILIGSANVFLTRGGDVKIGDFNVSKVAKRGMLYTQTGTPYYASPEVWKDMPYDAKSDVWSLGVILYEMCALKPPFRADDMEALYRKVLRGEYSCIPAAFSSDLECLVALLLQVNPVTRPSMGQLLQHPVMQAKISQLQSLSPALSLHSNNPNFEEIPPGDLLNTIKLPPNVGVAVRMSTKSSRITKNTRGGYTHTHNHAPSVHSAAETSLAVSLESVPPPPPPQPSHHEPAKSSVAGRGSPSADREGAGRENGKEKEREKESSQEQSKSDSSSKDREGKEGVGTSSSAARASSLPPRAPPSSSAPVRQRSESRAPPSDGGGNGSPPTRGDSSLPVGSRGKSSDKGRNSNSISNASGGGHGREAQRPSLGSPSSSHEKKDRGRVSPSSSHPSVPSSSDPARSREKEREKERERVKEKENEREREAAEQLERFRQRAREKEREREREKELSREREREKERERIRDREREEASWREKEKERAERRERRRERKREKDLQRDLDAGIIHAFNSGSNHGRGRQITRMPCQICHGVQMPLLPSISPLNLQAGGKAGGRTPPPAAASSVLPPVGSPPVISGGMPIDAERSRSRRRAGGGHAKDRGDKGGDRGGRGFINNHHQHPLSHHHQELPKLPCLPQIHRHDRDRGHHGGGDDDRGGGRERDRGRDREGGRRERDRDRDGTTRLPSLVCRAQMNVSDKRDPLPLFSPSWEFTPKIRIHTGSSPLYRLFGKVKRVVMNVERPGGVWHRIGRRQAACSAVKGGVRGLSEGWQEGEESWIDYPSLCIPPRVDNNRYVLPFLL